MRPMDLTGQRFGKLVVLGAATFTGKNKQWLCRCDCGGESMVRGTNLVGGSTHSCGCLRMGGKWQALVTETVDDGGMSLAEIGRRLGLTRSRVQQVYAAAMNKLRANPEVAALALDALDQTRPEFTYPASTSLGTERPAVAKPDHEPSPIEVAMLRIDTYMVRAHREAREAEEYVARVSAALESTEEERVAV